VVILHHLDQLVGVAALADVALKLAQDGVGHDGNHARLDHALHRPLVGL
jgi:hypothetical protein